MLRRPLPPFSNSWFLASLALFFVLEMFFGGFVGGALAGRYVSSMFHLKIQLLLFLGSVAVGGVLIGLISPTVRTLEPAAAAFVSVGLALLISVFLPFHFMNFSIGKLLIGGGIAAALAHAGAHAAERWKGTLPGSDDNELRGEPGVATLGVAHAKRSDTSLEEELRELKQAR